jgi:hypothetical protein
VRELAAVVSGAAAAAAGCFLNSLFTTVEKE